MSEKDLQKEILELKAELRRLRKNYLGLGFEDKPEDVVTKCQENIPVLKEVKARRITTKDGLDNLLLEGDNYHSLSILNYTHKGKIDLIYIDPPYNTGNHDFIYNDQYVDVEDGYRHSKWLSFMRNRLLLARELLKSDGMLFISIDDNEQAHLRILCDKIFGENNFVGMFSVENNPKGRKNGKFISVTNEYCLIYAKEIGLATFKKIIPKHAADMTEDESGDFVRKSGKRVLMGENTLNKLVSNFKAPKHYSAYIKDANLILKQEQTLDDVDEELIKNGYKRYVTFSSGRFVENTYTKEKFKELFEDKSLDIREDKIYEKHFSDLMQIKSMLTNDEYEAIVDNKKILYKIDLKTTSAKQQLAELLGNEYFNFPKNISFIKHLIALHPNRSATILDFFAGSGTTGHAVLNLNTEDGGSRHFILCTNDEDNNGSGKKIATDICYPRIKKVIYGYGEVAGIPSNLFYYKTDLIDIEHLHKIPDEAKIRVTYQAGEMIAVREDTLNEVEKNEWWQIFEGKGRTTAIYFKEDKSKLGELIEKMEKRDASVALYIFSWGKNEYKGEYSSSSIRVEDIPEPILEVYKEINRL